VGGGGGLGGGGGGGVHDGTVDLAKPRKRESLRKRRVEKAAIEKFAGKRKKPMSAAALREQVASPIEATARLWVQQRDNRRDEKSKRGKKLNAGPRNWSQVGVRGLKR